MGNEYDKLGNEDSASLYPHLKSLGLDDSKKSSSNILKGKLAPMKILELFTDEQMQILRKNGEPDQHLKNHKPVVYLDVPDMGYKFLLTEWHPKMSKMAFGLCDYDTELKFDYVDLDYLAKQIALRSVFVEAVKDFEGKYNLGVYATIADIVHTIIVDDTPSGYKNYFDEHANGLVCDPSENLNSLRDRFKWFYD